MALPSNTQPYTILQWNCRGLRNKKAELSLWVAQDTAPDIILLQEANLAPLTLRGYRVFSQPSIPPRCARQQATKPPGLSHILVKRSLPATQVPTLHLNTLTREVTTVLIQLASQPLAVTSVYWKPAPDDTDASWLAQVPSLAPYPCVIGGDFNAPHRAWGYSRDSPRGSMTLQVAESVPLTLLNSPNAPTRCPLHAAQSATTPDLTWLSPNLSATWDVVNDTRGSDHYPIRIVLTSLTRIKPRSTVPVVTWDSFRTALTSLPTDLPFLNACTKPDAPLHALFNSPTPPLPPINIF